eukprot:189221_1
MMEIAVNGNGKNSAASTTSGPVNVALVMSIILAVIFVVLVSLQIWWGQKRNDPNDEAVVAEEIVGVDDAKTTKKGKFGVTPGMLQMQQLKSMSSYEADGDDVGDDDDDIIVDTAKAESSNALQS